jgi:hypothetical protein
MPCSKLGRYMAREQEQSFVERFALEAIRLGANSLDVEYKDGYEYVFAMTGGSDYGVGCGIGRLRCASPEAASLRKELDGMARKIRRISGGDVDYELRCRIYDSFGEDAFHVEIRPVNKKTGARSRRSLR